MGTRQDFEDTDDELDEDEGDDDVISLDDFDDGPDLGPDERDRDLMDGTWEQEHYGGRRKSRDWNTIGLGIALLVIIAMLLPTVLVVFE